MQRLPYSFAKRFGIQIEKIEPLTLAYKQALTPSVLQEVRRVLGQNFALHAIPPDAFDLLLAASHESRADEALEGLGEGDTSIDALAQTLEPEDLLESQDDAPIIRFINALLTEAIKENASDIHIESFEARIAVRFRVDGVMRRVAEPPRGLGPLIISRIKVMAKLDIAEKRLPQDGRISLRIAGRAVDVRVSTLPSGHGERVVLRLLDKQAGRLQLDRLGMRPEDTLRLDALIHRPNGIILVTGPTGSGKTTTLYAALNRLNDNVRNILTVEDPIEYYFDGIGQTQVKAEIGMNFARGLRAILRQDPDVVMVGEIRDLETAEIAIQASLTGHLVLSTIHTNSALGAVTRLRDLGVEPFLLSSSLIGLVAQRLVRTLHDDCKVPYQASATECRLLGADPQRPPTLYQPDPARLECAQRGYRGRVGIYEIVEMDQKLRQMIHDGATEAQMEAYVRQKSPSLRADGFRQVLAGRTTIEEVLRATHEE
jgi:general secretion pathway protein E